MKLLRIDSSARRNSVSRQLTSQFVETWRKQNPKGEVIERTRLGDNPPTAHHGRVDAAYSDPAGLSTSQKHVLAASNTLVEELLGADTIVIGAHHAQLCDFPSFERMDRPGRACGSNRSFLSEWPQGLLRGKNAVVITSRGGSYRAGTPTAQYDYQEPYLRHILAFVGLTDVTFIHAENQKPGELGESSRTAAIAQIQEAAAEQTRAAGFE
jgi:FMN-dependent NADH-azoreductase